MAWHRMRVICALGKRPARGLACSARGDWGMATRAQREPAARGYTAEMSTAWAPIDFLLRLRRVLAPFEDDVLLP